MLAFLTAGEISEKLEELAARAEAIYEVAKEEGRELTAEEQAELIQIQGEDGSGGELAVQAKLLKTKRAIEQRSAAKLQNRLDSGEIQTPDDKAAKTDPENAIEKLRVPAVARAHGRLKAFEDSHQGEKEAYVSGRWIASVLGHKPSAQWLNDQGFSASMDTGNNDSGGLMVPGEMSRTIIRLVEEFGVARNQFGQQPVTGERWAGPVRVSGMTAYPVAETTEANEGSNTGTKSQPKYKQIELVMRKWKAWTKASDELNDRSFISLAEIVSTESATAFAYAEDNAGFNGDGTAAFHGITGVLNAVKAGSVKTFASTKLAFSDLTIADFEAMVAMLPDFAGINPVWNISKQGYYYSMHPLLMAAGGNTSSNLEAGGMPMFLGYPVVFTKVLPTTAADQADAKVVTFGDTRMGVKFGTNGRLRASISRERYWDEDQIGIKVEEFFDINVHSTGDATNAGSIIVGQMASS